MLVSFRSAPPRGRRPERLGRQNVDRRFDPRPRAGGDARRRALPASVSSFDPRPRAGGDNFVRLTPLLPIRFRSAPPRGRRQDKPAHAIGPYGVSIRAPAREATMFEIGGQIASDVSIRAPAREATSRWIAWQMRRTSFDPRPRAGGDERSNARQHGRSVSIRAPAREATRRGDLRQHTQAGFDPRPRAGGDGRAPLNRLLQGVSIRAPAREATCRQHSPAAR